MPSLDFDAEARRFRIHYAQQRAAWQAVCDELVRTVQAVVTQVPGLEIAKVEGRVKDGEECVRKFVRKYRAALEEAQTPYDIVDHITDLIGVRVVCLYEDELEKVAEALRPRFALVDVTDKVAAIESTEGSFGYKGLHLDLRLPAEAQAAAAWAVWGARPFELQVRTITQDAWSVLDHRIKYKKSIPGPLKRRINVLAALFELADREFRQIRDATVAELLQAPDETAEPQPDPAAPDAPAAAPASGPALNAFTFLKIAQHFFRDFDFEPRKVDLFVDEIQQWAPGLTRARFNGLMRNTLGTVKRYRQHYEDAHPGSSFNPFTVIRHCLYLSDRHTFATVLRKSAREAFEAWLASEAEAAAATPPVPAPER